MNTLEHFDEIAPRYDSEIPDHIRQHLLTKKAARMADILSGATAPVRRGLDCGCGTGHYLKNMADRGYLMSGLEYSGGMQAQAQKNAAGLRPDIRQGSITEMPYDDGSFDFAYTINVLHHLPSRDAQWQAIAEMLRVVRPGGFVFLQDFNADSIMTRLYMDYIFPLTSSIDDDETEIWISPKEIAARNFAGSRLERTLKFTLVPNFMPRVLFPLARAVEAVLEKTFPNRIGAHFLTVLTRTE